MSFAAGRLERLIRGRRGTFNDYDLVGDWLADVNGKRGWLIQIVNGLEQGSFSVLDGEIHRSGIHTPGTVEDSTDIMTDPGKAVLRKSAEQAIFDAITQWEEEERESAQSGEAYPKV